MLTTNKVNLVWGQCVTDQSQEMIYFITRNEMKSGQPLCWTVLLKWLNDWNIILCGMILRRFEANGKWFVRKISACKLIKKNQNKISPNIWIKHNVWIYLFATTKRQYCNSSVLNSVKCNRFSCRHRRRRCANEWNIRTIISLTYEFSSFSIFRCVFFSSRRFFLQSNIFVK